MKKFHPCLVLEYLDESHVIFIRFDLMIFFDMDN